MFGLLFGTAALIIYLPILVMIVFSFNTGRYQVMPFREFTWEWYGRVFQDAQFVAGFLNSIRIAPRSA